MRVRLAEQLLAKIMEWSPEQVSSERPLLQALADLKYDEYQQFSPGIRFIESLAQWLNQFDELEEKKSAYDFVKKQLIFISNNQISHLVNLSFTTKIRPLIIKKVAEELELSKYLIKKVLVSDNYKKELRRSLFIGLSDGSRIDQLRRYAHLNNEQVLTTYYIDDEKVNDLQKELTEGCGANKFSSIFLIDDFTASGTSYARFDSASEGSQEVPKGKILKLLNKIFKKEDDHLSNVIEKDRLSIHIIFYLATEYAIDRIKNELEKYKNKYKLEINYTVEAVQLLTSQVKDEVLANKKFIDLISQEKYFDNSIVDRHYQNGLVNNLPYLGFGECALPLVLYHNTPNNSIPLIWFAEDNKTKGLFPRITRHKE